MIGQPEQVVMTFEPGKPTEIAVNGVKGKACLAFSAPFEQALGGRVVDRKSTAEMSQQPVATVGTSINTGMGQQ